MWFTAVTVTTSSCKFNQLPCRINQLQSLHYISLCVHLKYLLSFHLRLCLPSVHFITSCSYHNHARIAHFRQKCHNSKSVIFQYHLLKVLKCYNFFMRATTTQLLSSGEFCKLRYDTILVHLQTFLSIPITQKCQILSFDILVENERATHPTRHIFFILPHKYIL